MKKKLAKHKIFITAINIIVVLLTPLLIQAVDLFLPKPFNPAINIMYIAYACLSIAGTTIIWLMWMDAISKEVMKQKSIKHKILITVINIVVMLLTPLLIGAIDMFLPKPFNFTVKIMYFAYACLSTAGIIIIWVMWMDEFIEREHEKTIGARAKEPKKIFITVVYVIVVLLTPLLIDVIDMFLPKVFNMAFSIMYFIYTVLSTTGAFIIILMWVNAMSNKIKHKILIAVINIIVVLLTSLLIGAIDIFLPKAFDSAINTMYFAYACLSIASTVMIILMWVNEFIEREHEKTIKQHAKEIRLGKQWTCKIPGKGKNKDG